MHSCCSCDMLSLKKVATYRISYSEEKSAKAHCVRRELCPIPSFAGSCLWREKVAVCFVGFSVVRVESQKSHTHTAGHSSSWHSDCVRGRLGPSLLPWTGSVSVHTATHRLIRGTKASKDPVLLTFQKFTRTSRPPAYLWAFELLRFPHPKLGPKRSSPLLFVSNS
jgi:hypothetical protein